MTDKTVKITCDYCGDWDESTIKGIGEKRLRRRRINDGWISLVVAGSYIRDFCSQDCYDNWKLDEIKSL